MRKNNTYLYKQMGKTRRMSKRSIKRSIKRSSIKRKRGGDGTIERVRAERREALNKTRAAKKEKAEADMHSELRRLDSFLGKQNTAESFGFPTPLGFPETTPLGFPETTPLGFPETTPIYAPRLNTSSASMTKKWQSLENKIIALKKKKIPFTKAKKLKKLRQTQKSIELKLAKNAVNKGMGNKGMGNYSMLNNNMKWKPNPLYISSRSSTSTDE